MWGAGGGGWGGLRLDSLDKRERMVNVDSLSLSLILIPIMMYPCTTKTAASAHPQLVDDRLGSSSSYEVKSFVMITLAFGILQPKSSGISNE